MPHDGFEVRCYRGAPPALPGCIEVGIGAALPVAFAGLRHLLAELRGIVPTVVERVAHQHPTEWNELFPNSFPDAPLLGDVANAPSERRVERESEQVFRVLQAAAQAVVEAVPRLPGPLVLRQTYACDLVSLRGLMRAIEWSRVAGPGGLIILADWEGSPTTSSGLLGERREQLLERLRLRFGASLIESEIVRSTLCPAPQPFTSEGHFLHLAMDPHQEPEQRMAAALLAIRSCFFSTNYEGALLAIEQGLAQLDREYPLVADRVRSAFIELAPDMHAVSAIELDTESLGEAPDLRALLWRSVGVIYELLYEHEAALSAFQRALQAAPRPAMIAQLHMYRALILVKRRSQVPEAMAEVKEGLAAVQDDLQDESLLEQGWLRNVLALAYYRSGEIHRATAEIKMSMKSLAHLHSDSAVHLKINLISNISVLLESTHRYREAVEVWQRFTNISSSWEENFLKHYRYRDAGLRLAAGRVDEAIQGYTQAFESAGKLGDTFHQQVIAAEMGRFYLDGGDGARAAEWFERAVALATAMGDPFRLGQSLVGRALATGEGDLRAAAGCACATLSYPAEAARMRAASASDADRGQLAALLPNLSTKLNRPFDLANL